ncbi:protein of unknown function DUF820 [Rippkaea orientalis PCC 8801]|uniref:Putative restriction endonuclease domain-containing protein n=1 Tax=Rippkaea orientalis (strain PCC 8801 / RF-1) TaxID=41431 RepID=B7K4D8_RIPO1|nr:Uma2 family endonuclease [Rippkaea orientalis]ACK67844.1 protein of unknown function DUF820 [Rippkaea orientalis PCC 8801]
MAIEIETRYYTSEEYLQREATATYKSEYHAGEIIPMTGGTLNHNLIAINFCKLFPLSINQQVYWTLMSDMRLWIPKYQVYTYPDVMIIENKPVYEGKGTTTVTNPLIIVEVLSKSTRDYDKTDKFKFYRSLTDFKEYLLIDQYSYYIEQYVKQDKGEWIFKPYEQKTDNLILSTVDLQIPLLKIYERVDFTLNED